MKNIQSNIVNYKCNISLDIVNKYNILSISSFIKYPAVDIIIWNNNEVFKEEYFCKFPNLKMLINWGTATSNLPCLSQFLKRSIRVKTMKGYSTNAVSEYIIYTLMKLLARSKPVRKELYGKKIGIIGMGNVGLHVTKLLKGFNCDISYYSQAKKNINIPFISLDELVKKSEAIVIAVDSKDFRVPLEFLKEAQKGLVICNISQDFILPAFEVIDSVNNRIIPDIDIISDNFTTKEVLKNYSAYYSPHIAYKSIESSVQKNNMLEDFIALL